MTDAANYSQAAGLEKKVRAQFSKSELCRFHPKCRAGNACPFAHGIQELCSRPQLAKTSLCRPWQRGKCHLQLNECAFAHGRDDLRKTFQNEENGITDANAAVSSHKNKHIPKMKGSVLAECGNGSSYVQRTEHGICPGSVELGCPKDVIIKLDEGTSIGYGWQNREELGCTKAGSAESVSFHAVRDDEDTDVGSSGSDTDSTCSSASASEQSEGGQQSLRNCVRERTLRGNTSLPRTRPRAPPRGRFGGTPLSPIPGTPVGGGDHTRLSFGFTLPTAGFASVSQVQAALASPEEHPDYEPMTTRLRLPPGLAAATQATKRQAREVANERSRREGAMLPKRIELAVCHGPTATLDPRLPAKKRPPFPECTSTVRGVAQCEPLKKRVTDFLKAEPPSVVTPWYARLAPAAR